MRRLFVFFLFAAALWSAATHSGTIQARVVKVEDGDSIVVAYRDGNELRVRIGAIDAPERAQRFSYESRKHLLTLVYGKTVQLTFRKVDAYGRLVAEVFADGVDVGLAQVQAGYAWHFKRYQDEQSLADRVTYAAAEVDAQQRKVGIWGVPGQIPPWDFRYRSRKGLSVVPSLHTESRMLPVSVPIIANKRSGVYHEIVCPSYLAVSSKNRIYFASRGQAEQAGYRRAKNCPDILD